MGNNEITKSVKTSLTCTICGNSNVKRQFVTKLGRLMGYRSSSLTLCCATCGWITKGLVK